MRSIYLVIASLLMTSCTVYEISGNTGVYVVFSGKTLPYYQTTVIEGNTTTDFRHVAVVALLNAEGEVVKQTKADSKGAFVFGVKNFGRYTIRAQFTDSVFVEKQIEVVEGIQSVTIDLTVGNNGPES